MKTLLMRQTAIVGLAFCLLTACGRSDVVSWCEADAGIIVITGGGEEDGLRYGDTLRIFAPEALPEVRRGVITSAPLFEQDLTDLKPMKVQAGDVTGDGIQEISICVYKTAEFHPVMAKRPFFYSFGDGRLTPVWLGSRLARPFDDYALADINGDGIDEIISIESLENGEKIVCAYYWKGFGFEELAKSDSFPRELTFVSPLVVRHRRDGDYRLWLSGDLKMETERK